MKLKNYTNNGFTIIEIIVALAILGIMTTAFLALFGGNYATIYMMGKKTQAMNNEAQTYMDQIYSGQKTVAQIDALPDVTATAPAYTTLNTLKQVTITVSYTNSRSVTLTSLVP